MDVFGAGHALCGCAHGMLCLPRTHLALCHPFAARDLGGTPPAEPRDGSHGPSMGPHHLNRVPARVDRLEGAASRSATLRDGLAGRQIQVRSKPDGSEHAKQHVRQVHLPFQQAVTSGPWEGVVA